MKFKFNRVLPKLPLNLQLKTKFKNKIKIKIKFNRVLLKLPLRLNLQLKTKVLQLHPEYQK